MIARWFTVINREVSVSLKTSRKKWYVVMQVLGLPYPGTSAPNNTFRPVQCKEQALVVQIT